jgi:flagellin FlaB
MRMKKMLNKLLKQKRGMVGIEAAIVLIAFVIVAAAFSFMVVNMGLFSTQRGRETIQQGISEASSPLVIDGSIYARSNGTGTSAAIDAMMIPLKTMGVRYVSMTQNTSEISVRLENHTAIADCYMGINPVNPLNETLTSLADTYTKANGTTATMPTACELFIGKSDGDSSLDYDEKGYLVFAFNDEASRAIQREHIFVEVRPEKGAPISIEFIVPPQLTEGWFTVGQ